MPKSKTKLSTKLQDYVKEFGNDFKTDKQILFCNICEVAVSTNQRSQVIQHLTSDKPQETKNNQHSDGTTKATIHNRWFIWCIIDPICVQ